VLTETFKSLERDNVELENVSADQVEQVFDLVDRAETAKESIEEIVRWLAKNAGKTPREAVDKLGLGMLSDSELMSIVNKLVSENFSFVKEQGDRAAGKLMGLVMSQVRGKADAKRVAALVKEKIVALKQ
jgi:Glu-tRNA(Gln) amidotransferase subunit E-like FAD-binding protein